MVRLHCAVFRWTAIKKFNLGLIVISTVMTVGDAKFALVPFKLEICEMWTSKQTYDIYFCVTYYINNLFTI